MRQETRDKLNRILFWRRLPYLALAIVCVLLFLGICYLGLMGPKLSGNTGPLRLVETDSYCVQSLRWVSSSNPEDDSYQSVPQIEVEPGKRLTPQFAPRNVILPGQSIVVKTFEFVSSGKRVYRFVRIGTDAETLPCRDPLL